MGEMYSSGLLCSTRLQQYLWTKAYEGWSEGTGEGVRLCYYLHYYGILICMIKYGRSDDGKEFQVYMNQGSGDGGSW